MNDILANGINQLNLECSIDQISMLGKYVELLLKWNKVYSLTAITDLEQVYILHILDGLGVIQFIPKTTATVLDVGSGMGVPGVLIAIMFPELKVTLIDSNIKKVAFLRQVRIELRLSNLEIIHKRIEDFNSGAGYDIIISRAFADLKMFVNLAEHLLAKNGQYLAMKSQQAKNETLGLVGYSFEIINLRIPYLNAPRLLVKIFK